MNQNDYRDAILLQLGYPVVNIEIEDQIPKIVDMAFRELKHYINDTQTLTIPYQEKIHIEDFNDPLTHQTVNIDTVVYVTRTSSPNNLADYQDMMYMISRQSSVQQVSLTDYNRAMLINQAKNTLSTDLDFYWDKKYHDLYVNANYPKPPKITIVYIPVYNSVDDITEEFWQNLLLRLSVALTKGILGRVRGKYKLNSSQYELDSDTLLQESQSELAEIRNYLNENSDMLLPID